MLLSTEVLQDILRNMSREAYTEDEPYSDTFYLLKGNEYKLTSEQADAVIASMHEAAEEIATEMFAAQNNGVDYFKWIGPISFICYGIRNVHTGDDEQTRVSDMERQDFLDAGLSAAECDLMEALLNTEEWNCERECTWHWSYYDVAYEYAITCAIKRLPKEVNFMKLARIWVDRWIINTTEEEDDATGEFLDLYQAIYNFYWNVQATRED